MHEPEQPIDFARVRAAAADPTVRNPRGAIEPAERAVRAPNPTSLGGLDAPAAALACADLVGKAAAATRIRDRVGSHPK